jgi:hypothetical protein
MPVAQRRPSEVRAALWSLVARNHAAGFLTAANQSRDGCCRLRHAVEYIRLGGQDFGGGYYALAMTLLADCRSDPRNLSNRLPLAWRKKHVKETSVLIRYTSHYFSRLSKRQLLSETAC